MIYTLLLIPRIIAIDLVLHFECSCFTKQITLLFSSEVGVNRVFQICPEPAVWRKKRLLLAGREVRRSMVVLESSSHSASSLAQPGEVFLFFTPLVRDIFGIRYCFCSVYDRILRSQIEPTPLFTKSCTFYSISYNSSKSKGIPYDWNVWCHGLCNCFSINAAAILGCRSSVDNPCIYYPYLRSRLLTEKISLPPFCEISV